MANYSLVINSQFKPFSYQEMLAPTLMATQAHQDVENQYGELEAKANIWEEMANEQTDPKAYKLYKTYANDLRGQADQLAKEGLNATSRRNALNMKSRYSKEIVPIEQAYAARAKQVEQQQQALLQNPTLMFSRNAATTSLDKYLENPQLNYESYSGALLADQVGKAAATLAKQIQDNPRKWRGILGNSYYETLMQRGFNSADVLLAVQNNSDANPELLRIVEDAIDSSNIRSWANKNMLDRAYGYARQGLWNAVGETQYQVLDNWRAKMAAQNFYDKTKSEIELKMHGYDKDGNIDPNNPYWALKGLKYDETTNTWKVVGKPGKPGEGASGGKSSTDRKPRLSGPIFINNDGEVFTYNQNNEVPQGGVGLSYSDMTDAEKNYVNTAIGEDFIGNYYFLRTEKELFGNDAGIVIIPKKTVVNDGTSDEEQYAESFANG